MSENKPIIAYLLEYPLDLPGGAQMSTESLCMGLVENGEFEPVVVCPHLLNKKPSDYPFRVITYDMGEKRIRNLLIRIGAFRRILGGLKPDIVHIQMPESLITYGLCFRRSGKHGGSKLIFTDRGLFYGYRKHSMTLMQMTLKRADLMLTTTEFNRQMWLEGSRVRPIEKVANTISEKFTEFDPVLRGVPGEMLTLGLAGRICEEKNWPFAVSLIKRIAEAGVKFKVDLVLSVFEKGDDEQVRMIVDGISEAIGPENLSFHQDFSQQEMQQYYYGVDIFLMTSRFESFGKAAVEAMSRGCAVISTEVGGLPEVVGRKENLYTEKTPEKAVEYIKHADEDREFLRAEQEYFLARFRDNFSQDRCLRDHLEIYRRSTR